MYKVKDHYRLVKQKSPKGTVTWYYYCYDEDGTRLKRSTGRKTRSEAVKVILERIDTGHLQYPEGFKPKRLSRTKTSKMLFVRSVSKSITFSEYTEVFFVYDKDPIIRDKIRRGGSYSESFCHNNRKSFEKNILPYFADYRVRSITPSMVNQWLLTLPQQGLSHVTCNKMKSLLNTVFKQAILDGLITDNPVDKIKPLAEKKSTKDAFTKEEIKKLFSVEWDNEIARAASLTSCLTGLRSGEIRALKIEKVSALKIIVDSSYEDRIGLKCTKSGVRREVPITNSLYNLLEDIYEKTGEGEYIFSITKGESPVSKAFLMRHLKIAMRRAGISTTPGERTLTFHSFRHFFNTCLIASGVSGEITRAVIGHQEEEMTMHYLHLTADNMDFIREIQEETINAM